jgi:phosphotransacetylase
MFRAMLFFGQGESAGIVVGAKVPLVLLSRAESPETKIRSIALALLVQQHQKN